MKKGDDKPFWNGVKRGAGRVVGAAVVLGVVGLVVAGPAGGLEGIKIGLGVGSMSGN